MSPVAVQLRTAGRGGPSRGGSTVSASSSPPRAIRPAHPVRGPGVWLTPVRPRPTPPAHRRNRPPGVPGAGHATQFDTAVVLETRSVTADNCAKSGREFRMVPISPWLDATLSAPASQTIDDPLLNYSEAQAWWRLWAGNLTRPIRGSAPYTGRSVGFRRSWSTPARWTCYLPIRFACESGLWRRAPTSSSYSGKVSLVGHDSTLGPLPPRRPPFAQTFNNS